MSHSLGTKRTEDDRLRQIARYAPGVIYQFRMRPDGSSCFPYASDGLQEVHGVSPAEVLEDSSKIFTFIHPEDIDRVTQSILESAANMTPWCCEYRVNLSEDRQRWLLGHSTPQRETDGGTLWHGYIRDITESKTTELAQQASENKFRSIIENLDDMVYMINADTSFSYLSPQFQEIMGYEIGEILNNSFAKLVHPEDLSICVDALHRSFQGEKIRGIEYRTLHKDGNYYWHSSNLSALRNEDGEIVSCLGVARYVHDRKQTEQSLQETNSLLHSVLETMPDFFFAKDLQGRHIAVNSNLAEFFGKSVADIIGRTDAELLPPDIAEKIMAKDREIMTKGITERFEEVVPTDGVKDSYYLTVKTPLFDAQGNVTGLIGVAQNITDRKQAEIALEENHLRLELALKTANIGSWDWNPQTNQVNFSTQWKAILGYADHEIENSLQEWESRVHPEDLPFVYENIGRHIRGEISFYQTEHRLRSKDGSYKWIVDQGQVAERDEQGNPVRFIGINFDISDRKAAELELEQFFNVALDLLCIADFNGHFRRLSRAWETTLGYSTQELEGQRLLDLVHPDDVAATLEVMSELSEQKPALQFTNRYRAKDGSYRYIEWRSVPSGDLIYAAARDITDRKNAEADREQAEKMLQLTQYAFNSAGNSMFWIRPDATFYYANQTTCNMLGYTLDELLSMSVFDVDADFPPDAWQEHWQQMKQQGSLMIESRQRDKNGRIYPVEILISYIEFDSKEYNFAQVTDITDRKAAEAALAESEAQNRAILQAIPDLMFRVNKTGIYLGYSTSTELLDLSTPHSVGKPMADELSPEHYQRHMSHLAIALETRQTQIYEQEVTIAGRIQHEEVRIVPLNDREEGLFMIRDIGDRKQAQKEQSRLLAILEATSDFVGSADPSGRVLYLNQSARKMLGLTPEDDISQRSLTQSHPEWANQLIFSEGLPETMQSGSWLGETAILKADGQEIPVSQLIVAHRSEESGEIEYFSTIARDISEQRAVLHEREAAETKLKEVSDRLSLALKSGGIGCWEWDIVQNALVWDDRMFELYGVNADSNHGLAYDVWINGLHPDDRDAAETISRQTLLGEIEYDTELRVIHPDGSIHFLRAFALVLRNAEGDPQKMIGINFDISDRKAAETKLNEVSDRLSLALKSGKIGCWEWDVVENVLMWDDRMYELYGVNVPPNTNLAFDVWTNGLHPDDRDASEKLIQQALLGQSEFNPEFRVVHPDGSIHFIKAFGLVQHDAEGNPQKMIGVNLDISDRKQAEALLQQQTAELEATLKRLQNTQTQLIQAEKMSSLGQLVGGIAHEINNPVSFIYGNIQPATDYVAELVDLVHLYQAHYPEPPQAISQRLEEIDLEYLVHDFSRLLESMKNGAARIRDIIKSLRTFSRLDEEGCKTIDIHENIDSTLVVLQSRFNGRDGKPEIQLIKNYGDLPGIECYSGLLNQVFVNLLMNAIDAIESRTAIEQQQNILASTQDSKYHGVITITTSLSSSNQAVISIQDNGCGMNAQTQEKIFNPFFTTKPIGQGTGMGLAISYQIITENHQGNISVNSTPGEGTEFVMTMPIKQNSELAIIEEFPSCAIDNEK